MASHGRMCCCIATFLNSACAVAVVDSKVTKMRKNFVEEEYCQMATEFWGTSLRLDISDACARHVIRSLPVTPAQLMTPGISRNASCALGDFHLGL